MAGSRLVPNADNANPPPMAFYRAQLETLISDAIEILDMIDGDPDIEDDDYDEEHDGGEEQYDQVPDYGLNQTIIAARPW